MKTISWRKSSLLGRFSYSFRKSCEVSSLKESRYRPSATTWCSTRRRRPTSPPMTIQSALPSRSTSGSATLPAKPPIKSRSSWQLKTKAGQSTTARKSTRLITFGASWSAGTNRRSKNPTLLSPPTEEAPSACQTSTLSLSPPKTRRTSSKVVRLSQRNGVRKTPRNSSLR